MQMNLGLLWNADCLQTDGAETDKVMIAAYGLFSFKGYAACPLLPFFQHKWHLANKSKWLCLVQDNFTLDVSKLTELETISLFYVDSKDH